MCVEADSLNSTSSRSPTQLMRETVRNAFVALRVATLWLVQHTRTSITARLRCTALQQETAMSGKSGLVHMYDIQHTDVQSILSISQYAQISRRRIRQRRSIFLLPHQYPSIPHLTVLQPAKSFRHPSSSHGELLDPRFDLMPRREVQHLDVILP